MGILRSDLLTHSQLQPTGSVFFDGTDDKITVVGFGNIGTSDFTLECWVYLSTTAGIQRIISANEGSQSTEYTAIRSNSNHGWQGYIGTDSGWWEGHSGNDHPSWTTGWHHVVLQRFGNDGYIFVDGEYVITDQDGSSASNAADPVTVTTFVLGHGIGSEYLNAGYISNARVSMKAVYGGNDFTVPKFELQPRGDTYLLCCQSSSSSSEAAVLPRDVTNPTAGLSVTGAAASSFHPGLKKDITDTGVVFDGFTVLATSTYMIPPSGKTTERNRGRGLFAGGDAPIGNVISSIEIQSQGNAADFGDLTQGRLGTGSVGSSTRGLISSGYAQPANANVATIDFVTIANTSNATTFGDSTQARHELGASSSETRAIFGGGTSPSLVDTIDFVTIATAGDATDFGNLTVSRRNVTGVSSPTRSVFLGGRASGDTASDVLDFVTIASTGNATDFGNLTVARGRGASVCSSTRGVMCGGETPTAVNTIDFITIASAGNATDFGDCITTRQDSAGGASNKTRGAFLITYVAPAYTNAIQFITIATTGNSADFGDNTVAGGRPHGFSDSHGGLS